MHKLILGKRNHSAHTRIMKAARALSDQFEIHPDVISALDVREKDPEVRAMKEREAVAELLEAVALALDIDLNPEPEAQVESAPEAGDAADGEGVARKTGEEFITVPTEGEPVTQETGGSDETPDEAVSQGDAGEGFITVPTEGEPVTQETGGSDETPDEAVSQGDAGEGLPAPDVDAPAG